MESTFERRGLGYRMVLPSIVTEIKAAQLSRSRGELHGEITVTMQLPGSRSADGHLHQAHMNLSSAETRSRLAKMLAIRANTNGDVDWVDILENFCRAVLSAEREGEPIIRVGTLPVPPEPPWRLDPILLQSEPVILFGEGGVGKSTLAAAIGVSVETGVALIPGWIPRKAPVLYLDWEADRYAINSRVRGVAMGLNLPGPASIMYRPCYGPLHRQVEPIIDAVAEHEPGLIIVDSMGLALGTGSDGGDASETAIKLFGAFRAMTVALPGCAILGIHHISKSEAGAEGKPAKPYGSIYHENAARATFEMRQGSDGGLALYNGKANNHAKLPVMALRVVHGDDGSIRYERLDAIPEDLAKPLPLHERVYRLLIEGHLDASAIAETLDEPPNKVRVILNRHKSLFNRLPSNKWEAIPRAS